MKKEENLKRVRFLEDEQLFLTPLSMDDLDYHYRWDHDRELNFLDRMPYRPKSYEQMKSEFQSALTSKDSMFFSVIAKNTGKLLGTVVLVKIDMVERTAHWGIKLAKEYCRQGYGTRAAKLLLRYAFEDLGLRKLRSGTHSGNVASQKYQKKLGFVREGVLRKEITLNGQIMDDMLYSMLKEEYEALYGSGKSK